MVEFLVDEGTVGERTPQSQKCRDENLNGTPKKITCYKWLVVWNMNFIFHNIWDNPSN